MRTLLRHTGLLALALVALIVPVGRAAPTVGRLDLAASVLCQGDECNGKFPSANGCVTDGHTASRR